MSETSLSGFHYQISRLSCARHVKWKFKLDSTIDNQCQVYILPSALIQSRKKVELFRKTSPIFVWCVMYGNEEHYIVDNYNLVSR